MCHLEDGRGRMMTVPSDSGQCCSNTCSITIMMVLCSVLTMHAAAHAAPRACMSHGGRAMLLDAMRVPGNMQ